MDVKKEYERIKELFKDCDESQLSLIDGAIWEAARIRVELDRMNEIVKVSGLLKVHPNDLSKQKELPVSKLIVKLRASYLNYIYKLSNMLDVDLDEEEELSDYE